MVLLKHLQYVQTDIVSLVVTPKILARQQSWRLSAFMLSLIYRRRGLQLASWLWKTVKLLKLWNLQDTHRSPALPHLLAAATLLVWWCQDLSIVELCEKPFMDSSSPSSPSIMMVAMHHKAATGNHGTGYRTVMVMEQVAGVVSDRANRANILHHFASFCTWTDLDTKNQTGTV